MNTNAPHPISGVPSAAGNRDVARQNNRRGDLPLEADHEESVEVLEKPNADRNRAWRLAQLKKRQEAEVKQHQLPQDPFLWIGMKVRRKKDAAIFTIRTVFKNQRVELEKSWMTYPSDVPTIRAGFEPAI